MHERRFGSETEYGAHIESAGKTITATAEVKNGIYQSPPGTSQLSTFFSRELYPYLKEEHGIKVNYAHGIDIGPDIEPYINHHFDGVIAGGMLSNGARLYLDQNRNIEWCTPEAVSPSELLVYEFSADQLLCSAFNKIKENGGVDAFQINRRSSDYLGNSRGYHENFSSHMEGLTTDDNFVEFLASYLAMRNLFAGAGGYVADGYVMSPRAYATTVFSSGGSADTNKPLIRRQETDHDGVKRYQFVSTEAANLPEIVFMRHALNEVIALSYEQDIDLSHLVLDNPLEVAQNLTHDLSIKNKYRLYEGQYVTAREWLDDFVKTMLSEPDIVMNCSDDAFRALGMLSTKLELSDRKSVFEWQKRKEYIDSRVPNPKEIERRVIYDLHWDMLDRGYIYRRSPKLLSSFLELNKHAFSSLVSARMVKPGDDAKANRRANLINAGRTVIDWDTYIDFEGEEMSIET